MRSPRVPALAEFGEGLRALRARRAGLDLGVLVEECLRFRDYELAALGLPIGEARYANLRRLVLLAERYGQVRGADVRGFLRFVQPGGRPGRRSGRGGRGRRGVGRGAADDGARGEGAGVPGGGARRLREPRRQRPAGGARVRGRGAGGDPLPAGRARSGGRVRVRRAVRGRQGAGRCRGAADHVRGDDAGAAAPERGGAGVPERRRQPRLGGGDEVDRGRAACGGERAGGGAGGRWWRGCFRAACVGRGGRGAGRSVARARSRLVARPAGELLSARAACSVFAPVPPAG